MKQNAPNNRGEVPHLVFIASRDHLDPDITGWPDWAAKEGLLHHFSSRENWPSRDTQPNYGVSKLMLMYAVEEICKRAVGADGTYTLPFLHLHI
jgi:hypothetical protein